MTASAAFQRLHEIVLTLRGPDGCPWDKKQTPQSLRGNLLEEAYEIIEAVDAGDADHVAEELGDVLLLVVMISSMYEERGDFTVFDVLSTISEKLVRRHPHVFADSVVDTPDAVLDQWNRIKVEEEGRREKNRHLDDVPSALPSLERAHRLQKRAAEVGFDWPDLEGVFRKVTEEISEVRAEADASAVDSSALEEEVGDLLFSVVNVARFLDIDPSVALHRANQKFFNRFGVVEESLARRGKSLGAATLTEMDNLGHIEIDGR